MRKMKVGRRYMYDSVVEAAMCMVYDSNRRLVGVGDVYPSESSLQKGEYTLKVLLRHDDPLLLARLQDSVLLLERKLKEAVTLPVYPSQADALRGSNPLKEFHLCPGERRALFVGPLPEDDKMPKDALPGRVLLGNLQLAKLSDLAGAKDAPTTIPISYTVPPKKETKESPKVADAPKDLDSSPEEKAAASKALLGEMLRDARVKFLEDSKASEVSGAEAKVLEDLAEEILEEHPGHLPVLLWKLKIAEAALAKDVNSLQAVVSASDAVLSAVDEVEVAKFVAMQNPEEGAGAAARKKLMEEQKTAILAAVRAKALALINHEFAQLDGKPLAGSEAVSPEAGAAWKQLRRWADSKEEAHVVLQARWEAISGRYAAAVRILLEASKPADKLPDREALELEIKLLEKLGWGHWSRAESSRLKDAFPREFRPF